MSDDGELVNGLKARNFMYQQEFLEKFGAQLSSCFLSRTKSLSEQELEDIIFECLYYFIEHPEKIDLSRSQGRLWGVLFVSVKNKIYDVLRTRSKEPKFFALDDVETMPYMPDNEDENTDTGANSQLRFSLLSEAKKMLSALKLTETDQEQLRLRLEEKFSSKEVADYLNITPNAESVRWNRLMAKINKHLGDYPLILMYMEKLKQEVTT